MLLKSVQQKRKGSVLVEYGLLIAGIVIASVVGVAVLGHKTADAFSLMAVIMPGAHTEDNANIKSSDALIPFVDNGSGALVLDTSKLTGVDRVAGVVGAGNGEVLIPE